MRANSELVEVSEPVTAVPNQPISGDRKDGDLPLRIALTRRLSLDHYPQIRRVTPPNPPAQRGPR